MGAEVTYRVRVLRLVEDVIEVSAVTATEAMYLAKREPEVAGVVGVVYEDETLGEGE